MHRVRNEETFLSISPQDSWRITFSDVITLLMTFFVMIVAMSGFNDKTIIKTISLNKDKDIVMNLHEKFLPPDAVMLQAAKSAFSVDLLDKILSSFPQDEGRFFISESERGTVLTISDPLVFEPEGAKLSNTALKYLQAIAASLKETQDFISIEGHTARSGNDEADSKLTLQMAASVLDYFIYESGMSPTRFSIAGYGSRRPAIYRNKQAMESRLEIVILKVRPYTETAGMASIQ
ncbi:MAG TPA: OmpA family protein [Desulfomonilia bacterium]|jgi:chemotaxis protein MotB